VRQIKRMKEKGNWAKGTPRNILQPRKEEEEEVTDRERKNLKKAPFLWRKEGKPSGERGREKGGGGGDGVLCLGEGSHCKSAQRGRRGTERFSHRRKRKGINVGCLFRGKHAIFRGKRENVGPSHNSREVSRNQIESVRNRLFVPQGKEKKQQNEGGEKSRGGEKKTAFGASLDIHMRTRTRGGEKGRGIIPKGRATVNRIGKSEAFPEKSWKKKRCMLKSRGGEKSSGKKCLRFP